MFELQGKYASAKVFTDNCEGEAISQIMLMLNQPFCENSSIRIMPDCHAGKGCTIGTTMTIHDKIVANLVGVDIGCGMLVASVDCDKNDLDLETFDMAVHKVIPCGHDIREESHEFLKNVDLENMECKKQINISRANLSLGTLGGGNHFIELDTDSDGKIYLVIHTGSRYLGKQVAEFYQKLAIKNADDHKALVQKAISKYKEAGRQREISNMLKTIGKESPIPKDLCYLSGTDKDMYLHDMRITQEYATWNRLAIAEEIRKAGYPIKVEFTTIHNYIDMSGQTYILRKGAVSARKGERLIIPLNMRDGSLICEGLGNPDWNYSAPHGAGRVYSRSKAKEKINMEDYRKSMEGIYSSCINESTIDESPFAYKPSEEILDCISDQTVKVVNHIKPIYNFKASDL